MIRTIAAAVVGVALAMLPAPASASGHVPPDSLTVLRPGGVDPFTAGVVSAVARAAGGDAVVVHQDTVRLLEVRRAGEAIQRAAAGFAYPLAASWMDPDRSHLVVADDVARVLASGAVVMSERSARLRGALVGDVLLLEGHGETVAVPIGAVVPDGAISWNELVLPAGLAGEAGLWRPSRIVVSGVDDARRVERLLRFVLREPIRIWIPGDGSPSEDWVLPVVLIKERFGEFSYREGRGDSIQIDPGWLEEHIVWADIHPIGRFRCHVEVVPYLRAAFAELAARGMLGEIDAADFRRAGGCFNARLIRGANAGTSVSRHSWGIAIDLNPGTNRYGGEVGIPEDVGNVFRSWGFAWGAGWTVPDGMHFEWQREPEGRCSPFLAGRPPDPRDVYARNAPCAPS